MTKLELRLRKYTADSCQERMSANYESGGAFSHGATLTNSMHDSAPMKQEHTQHSHLQ